MELYCQGSLSHCEPSKNLSGIASSLSTGVHVMMVLRMTGELAQLVERCDRTAEVSGSNPLFSIFIEKLRQRERVGFWIAWVG